MHSGSVVLWKQVLVRVIIAYTLYVLILLLIGKGIAPHWTRPVVLLSGISMVCQPLLAMALSGVGVSKVLQVGRLALIYTVPSFLFLVPILKRFGTDIIGTGDSLLPLWNAWWLKQVFVAGKPLFFSDAVYAPIGAPLVFHTFVPIQSTLIALLMPFTGEAFALNLVAFLAIPLAGIGAYALCMAIGSDRSACTVAGFVFAWSPFLTSKLGWLNMTYCGILALFAAALTRAVALDGNPANQQSIATLTLAALALQFSGDVTAVFAANLVVVRLVGCVIKQGSLKRPAMQATRAFAPAAIALAPYLVLVLIDLREFWGSISRRVGLPKFLPSPMNYLLPSGSSIHLNSIQSLTGPLARSTVGLACYLGLLVFPMAVMGWYCGRHRPEIRFWTVVSMLFLILSFGPFLFLKHWRVPLPFAFWSRLPVLGSVAQSGRYIALVYMAMAVGVAVWLSSKKLHPSLLVGAVLVIGVDFGFAPSLSPLPSVPPLADRPGAVMDGRIYRGETMYYQTKHERPLVGGYLARPAKTAIAFYHRSPCISWLMFSSQSTAPCDQRSMKTALADLNVTDILLDRDDVRQAELMRLGFERLYEDQAIVVWTSLPTLDSQHR